MSDDFVHDTRPFPVESLPEVMSDAVLWCAEYVQAPLPVIVGSALAALSLAGQGLANVFHPAGWYVPTSLYLLTASVPGDRKTTCNQLFLKPIWDYQERTKKGPCLIRQDETLLSLAHSIMNEWPSMGSRGRVWW